MKNLKKQVVFLPMEYAVSKEGYLQEGQIYLIARRSKFKGLSLSEVSKKLNTKEGAFLFGEFAEFVLGCYKGITNGRDIIYVFSQTMGRLQTNNFGYSKAD